MARCGKTKLDSHINRNLQNTIRNEGKIVPVTISTVQTRIRVSKRRRTLSAVSWPVIRLSSWAECIFDYGGHMFLGGRDLDHADSFAELLADFWAKFQKVDGEFSFLQRVPQSEWSKCVPIAIHGDEGRGKQKLPCMVVGIQCLLPINDYKTNMSG